MLEKQTILKTVVATVPQFDPEAQVILYGSQARGDGHTESDWDFLAFAKKPDSLAFKKDLRQALYLLEVA